MDGSKRLTLAFLVIVHVDACNFDLLWISNAPKAAACAWHSCLASLHVIAIVIN